MNVRLVTTGTVVVLIHMVVLGGMLVAVKFDGSESAGKAPADQTDYKVASANPGIPTGGLPPVADPSARPSGPGSSTYVKPPTNPNVVPLPPNNNMAQPNNTTTTNNSTTNNTATAGADGVRYHVVKSGDSFWKLSKQYNVKIDDLLSANGFSKKDTLQVGVRLKIPGS